jgi:hypothetical protein
MVKSESKQSERVKTERVMAVKQERGLDRGAGAGAGAGAAPAASALQHSGSGGDASGSAVSMKQEAIAHPAGTGSNATAAEADANANADAGAARHPAAAAGILHENDQHLHPIDIGWAVPTGMNLFASRVLRVIMAIPRGQVTSYGQVAALAGSRTHARLVGMGGVAPGTACSTALAKSACL